MGSYDYNSDAIPKVEAATDAIEDYANATMPKIITFIEEIADQSGSKKFKDNVASLRETTDAFKKTLLEFCGEPGDKMDSGTLHGYNTGARKLAEVLGE